MEIMSVLNNVDMREIKFRAWDKEKKRMLPHSDLHKILVGFGSIVSIGYKPKGGGWDAEDPYHFTNPQTDNTEIMQYTGLKDKNGVDIYEGDIVKTIFEEESPMGKEIVFEVKWLNDNSRWCLYNYKAWNHEVIGNIYENQELLLK